MIVVRGAVDLDDQARLSRWASASTGSRARSFPASSMGPKVEAVCRFVEAAGAIAAIGRLSAAPALLNGTAGTTVVPS